MTAWTMNQVRQARGLRAVARVDAATLDRYGDDARESAVSKMARKLREDAHAFAIELDDRDFEVQWFKIEGQPWDMEVRVQWSPATTEVELQGGPVDGMRVTIPHVGDALRVPRFDDPVAMLDADAHCPTAVIPDLADTYELVGWREDERVWVYATRE